jgi:hypothetical protein
MRTIDRMFGFPQGTTTVGVPTGGACMICQGIFIEATSANVSTDISNLLAFAGPKSILEFPTDQLPPAVAVTPIPIPQPSGPAVIMCVNCVFTTQEFQADPTIQRSDGQYQAVYKMVVRAYP